jgi:hypothetical protein
MLALAPEPLPATVPLPLADPLPVAAVAALPALASEFRIDEPLSVVPQLTAAKQKQAAMPALNSRRMAKRRPLSSCVREGFIFE